MQKQAQGTIEEPFEKAFTEKSIAQGTIEYLVIIGIIIIIGLTVVSMSVGFIDQGSGVSEKSTKIANWTNTISITETSVDPDGNYLVRLANNSGEELTITKVKIGDTNANYSSDLFNGGAQNFVVNSSEACTLSEGVTKQVTITYVSKNGLTKTETFPADTYFNCEEYNVSLLANQCETCTTYTTRYLDPTTPNFLAGYYDANDLNTIDTDLNANSILNGVEIFGVTGTASSGTTLEWSDISENTMEWQDAYETCAEMNTADFDGSYEGWRLPTAKELDAKKGDLSGESLWSSSPVPSDSSLAYYLDSSTGEIYYDFIVFFGSYKIRCVREI